jgi:hypothetical protein
VKFHTDVGVLLGHFPDIHKIQMRGDRQKTKNLSSLLNSSNQVLDLKLPPSYSVGRYLLTLLDCQKNKVEFLSLTVAIFQSQKPGLVKIDNVPVRLMNQYKELPPQRRVYLT